jgi:putative DNA primase/helicase
MRQIEARTFYPQDEAAMIRWAKSQNERGFGIYFQHAVPIAPITKKWDRENIKGVRFLHVDVDKHKGETDEQVLMRLLNSAPYPPTAVWLSGGGAQALWAIAEPIIVDGDLARCDDAKLYNAALCPGHADASTFNVDRILRLPGFVNWPNAAKVAKGRVAVESRVHKLEAAVYPLERFSKAPPPPPPAAPTLDLDAAYTSGPVDWRSSPAVKPEVKTYLESGQFDAGYVEKLKNEGRLKDDSPSGLFFHAMLSMRCRGLTLEQLSSVVQSSDKIREYVDGKARGWLETTLKNVEERYLALPVTINPKTPYKTAQLFRERQHPHLIHHNQDFLTYVPNVGCYEFVHDRTMNSEVTKWLATCKMVVQVEGEDKKKVEIRVPVQPNGTMRNNVVEMLEDIAHVPGEQCKMPFWAPGVQGPDPKQCMVFRNGILHVPSGKLYPLTPDYLNVNVSPCDYDPKATCPEWERVMAEQWFPDQRQDMELLQEFGGLCLVPDMSFHKALYVYGPKRSGKGTIARIHQTLMGGRNVYTPTLSGLARSDFALHPAIGKLAMYITDARLTDKAHGAVVTQLILNIVGGDAVMVNRKKKDILASVYLNTRLLMFGNGPPEFPDEDGTVATRLLPIRMMHSYWGREDHKLEERLRLELSGIANWFIYGYRRLLARGKFAPSAATLEAVEAINDASNTLTPWLRDRCGVTGNPDHWVGTEPLYTDYCGFCDKANLRPLAKNAFAMRLGAINLGEGRVVWAQRKSGGGRPYGYAGLYLLHDPPECDHTAGGRWWQSAPGRRSD